MKALYIFCIIMAAATFCSCNGYLDEDPKGQISGSTFFSTQDELDMAVYALYRQVAGMTKSTNSGVVRWQGDDLTTNPGSNKQNFAEVDAFHPSDNNGLVQSYWSTLYYTIKAANFIVNNAARTPTTEEEINIAMGQAKVWRAIGYFYLVRAFGPVPLNLDGKVNYNRPVASVAEVYEQIEQDLRDAINILPTDYHVVPRKVDGSNVYITKQAAQSVLVAVLMAEAGWPLNNTAKYAEAAAVAKEVIDGVNNGTYDYTLESDYKNVYAISHNNSKEIVIGINHGHAGKWTEDFVMNSSDYFESLGGWGDGWGEIQFWEDFPDGERKDYTYNKKILYNNGRSVADDPNNGKLFDWWEKCAPAYTEYHPMLRIFTVGKDASGNVTDYDYTQEANDCMCTTWRERTIRYSEVLLWYAESQARADGAPNQLAYDCLNKVRVRAGEQPVSGMGGTDFADLCVKEHGWEVCGNWTVLVSRRDDQLRMNILKKTFDERKENKEFEVAPGVIVKEQVIIPPSVTWKGENSVYLPYPSLDAQLNRNLKR